MVNQLIDHRMEVSLVIIILIASTLIQMASTLIQIVVRIGIIIIMAMQNTALHLLLVPTQIATQ